MHLSDDIYPSRGALDPSEQKMRPTPDHIGHKVTNDMEWALNEAATSDNIKPAVSEILDGITPPEKRTPRTLGDISREEFEELMGKATATEIIDTAFEKRKEFDQIVSDYVDAVAPELGRRTFDDRAAAVHLAPDQIVTLIRAEVDNDLPTYLLALSNVIISLRVTVTHLVVTGGPPPAMCQAA
jgi:hypothetical protein